MRNSLLRLCSMLLLAVFTAHAAQVEPNYRIELPRDGGSHPEFATEWWYLTGWLMDDAGVRRGFQITFFRSRNTAADANPSRFAPKQILFAHAAISDATQGSLLRAERTARAGFGLAEAATEKVNVSIDDWSLRADGANLATSIAAESFSLSLTLRETQPLLLHGANGYSRKGAASASHYYSLPQLHVSGTLKLKDKSVAVRGQAWFDHEWSNTYVEPQSAGWDWIGINLDDGGALMAFRMRDAQGRQRWSSATLREGNRTRVFENDSDWAALQHWRSPRTGVTYPIAWRVRLGEREFELRPLIPDQENDARGSVGILYWEGAVEVFDTAGARVGRGYLELTGYDRPVRF